MLGIRETHILGKGLWNENGRKELKGLFDYSAVDERLINAVLDTKDVRRYSGDSDHFAVLVGVRIMEKCTYGVRKNGGVKVLASEMKEKECKEDG